jgi:phosphate/sulfate permease
MNSQHQVHNEKNEYTRMTSHSGTANNTVLQLGVRALRMRQSICLARICEHLSFLGLMVAAQSVSRYLSRSTG